MTTITQIIPYGKTRDKVLTAEGLVLIFYKSEMRRLHLVEGFEISDEMYEHVIIPLLSKRARERLVYILKNSDKPESELRRKLKEGYYPEEAIEDAIIWCKSKHYIDDGRYIENYIRYHSDGKSRKAIRIALMQKGLRREDIDSFLEDTEIDETSQIEAELRRRHFRKDMDIKEKQRIFAALMRKGYSFDAISSVANDRNIC